jgi:putative OPT family oligopeptide transporter
MKSDHKAIAFGLLVTALLSSTMVVAGLKAGITPGVSPLVILCAWGAFAAASRGTGGKRFLNLAQVAGSAGMAVVAGVIFPAPLLQHLHLSRAEETLRGLGISDDLRAMPWADAKALLAEHGLSIPPIDIPTMMIVCLAGALIGYGFVGLATRKFLTDPTLPAPEARACETMIGTATADSAQRPKLRISLVLGLTASFIAPLLAHIGAAKEHVVLYTKQLGDRSFTLDLPFTPIYIGIGGLLTLATALLVFAGSFLRLIGDFALASIAPASDLALSFPSNSMRWVGGGAMTVAVAYSLVKFMGPRVAAAGAALDSSLLDVPPKTKRLLGLAIAAGVAILATWLFATDGVGTFAFAMIAAVLVMALLMVTLGAILSLQIGSSASPVSGTIFVTTLVLCLVALAVGRQSVDDVPLLMALLVGACVAVCTANDSSQDYKTLQLCGVAPREGFTAQLLGLLVGCIVVPLSLYVAHEAYGLGTNQLTAPQGQMFATLVDGLLLQESLPWTPILLGLAVGVAAVTMDIMAGKRGLQLPAMALAVGIYLPAYLGIGILIGSLCRYFGERARETDTGRRERTHECILAAAGLITGAAALDLLLGVGVLFGFDIASLAIFSSAGKEGLIPIPGTLTTISALGGIAFLGWILFQNARVGTSGETENETKA